MKSAFILIGLCLLVQYSEATNTESDCRVTSYPQYMGSTGGTQTVYSMLVLSTGQSYYSSMTYEDPTVLACGGAYGSNVGSSQSNQVPFCKYIEGRVSSTYMYYDLSAYGYAPGAIKAISASATSAPTLSANKDNSGGNPAKYQVSGYGFYVYMEPHTLSTSSQGYVAKIGYNLKMLHTYSSSSSCTYGVRPTVINKGISPNKFHVFSYSSSDYLMIAGLQYNGNYASYVELHNWNSGSGQGTYDTVNRLKLGTTQSNSDTYVHSSVVDTSRNYAYVFATVRRSSSVIQVMSYQIPIPSISTSDSNFKVTKGKDFHSSTTNAGKQYRVMPEALVYCSSSLSILGLGTPFRMSAQYDLYSDYSSAATYTHTLWGFKQKSAGTNEWNMYYYTDTATSYAGSSVMTFLEPYYNSTTFSTSDSSTQLAYFPVMTKSTAGSKFYVYRVTQSMVMKRIDIRSFQTVTSTVFGTSSFVYTAANVMHYNKNVVRQFFYYGGSTSGYAGSTFSQQVGFVNTRTDAQRTCYWSSFDDEYDDWPSQSNISPQSANALSSNIDEYVKYQFDTAYSYSYTYSCTGTCTGTDAYGASYTYSCTTTCTGTGYYATTECSSGCSSTVSSLTASSGTTSSGQYSCGTYSSTYNNPYDSPQSQTATSGSDTYTFNYDKKTNVGDTRYCNPWQDDFFYSAKLDTVVDADSSTGYRYWTVYYGTATEDTNNLASTAYKLETAFNTGLSSSGSYKAFAKATCGALDADPSTQTTSGVNLRPITYTIAEKSSQSTTPTWLSGNNYDARLITTRWDGKLTSNTNGGTVYYTTQSAYQTLPETPTATYAFQFKEYTMTISIPAANTASSTANALTHAVTQTATLKMMYCYRCHICNTATGRAMSQYQNNLGTALSGTQAAINFGSNTKFGISKYYLQTPTSSGDYYTQTYWDASDTGNSAYTQNIDFAPTYCRISTKITYNIYQQTSSSTVSSSACTTAMASSADNVVFGQTAGATEGESLSVQFKTQNLGSSVAFSSYAWCSSNGGADICARFYEYRIKRLCIKADNGYQVVNYGPDSTTFTILLKCGSSDQSSYYSPTWSPKTGQNSGDSNNGGEGSTPTDISSNQFFYFKLNNPDVATTSSNSNPNQLAAFYDARSDGDGYNDAFTGWASSDGGERCGVVNYKICTTGSSSYVLGSGGGTCPIQEAGVTYSSTSDRAYYITEPALSGISTSADQYWTFSSSKGGTVGKRQWQFTDNFKNGNSYVYCDHTYCGATTADLTVASPSVPNTKFNEFSPKVANLGSRFPQIRYLTFAVMASWRSYYNSADVNNNMQLLSSTITYNVYCGIETMSVSSTNKWINYTIDKELRSSATYSTNTGFYELKIQSYGDSGSGTAPNTAYYSNSSLSYSYGTSGENNLWYVNKFTSSNSNTCPPRYYILKDKPTQSVNGTASQYVDYSTTSTATTESGHNTLFAQDEYCDTDTVCMYYSDQGSTFSSLSGASTPTTDDRIIFIKHQNTASGLANSEGATNYYKRLWIHAYTQQVNNSNMRAQTSGTYNGQAKQTGATDGTAGANSKTWITPKADLTASMYLLIDVCGNEAITDPTTGNGLLDMTDYQTYYIEPCNSYISGFNSTSSAAENATFIAKPCLDATDIRRTTGNVSWYRYSTNSAEYPSDYLSEMKPSWANSTYNLQCDVEWFKKGSNSTLNTALDNYDTTLGNAGNKVFEELTGFHGDDAVWNYGYFLQRCDGSGTSANYLNDYSLTTGTNCNPTNPSVWRRDMFSNLMPMGDYDGSRATTGWKDQEGVSVAGSVLNTNGTPATGSTGVQQYGRWTSNGFNQVVYSFKPQYRSYLIDTADNTSAVATYNSDHTILRGGQQWGYNETFYVMVVTRGAVRKFFRQMIKIKCGQETVDYNTTKYGTVLQFRTPQNSSYDDIQPNWFMVDGFYSNCPQKCGLTRYYIEDVIDKDGNHWCEYAYQCKRNYTDYFGIDQFGNLTVYNTTKTTDPLMVYIYSCTDQVCSDRGRNVLNLTVYPFFSFNPNVAPVFEGIVGYTLPMKDLYINYNYSDQNYTLPKVFDYDGDETYIDVYLRQERMFTLFDNSSTTKLFKFRNVTILPQWEGKYRTTVTIGDNNWLGPRETNYQLTFNVRWVPNATFVPVPANQTSQGAEINDMGLTGKIGMDFKVPAFINPKYYRKPANVSANSSRLLQDSNDTSSLDRYTGLLAIPEDSAIIKNLSSYNITNTNSENPSYSWCQSTDGQTGNTSWIICEKQTGPVPVPKEPEYNIADIDDRILDVYVIPSKWQDPTKVNLTWKAASLSDTGLQLQIVFQNYEFISVNGLDQIVIQWKVDDAFLSKSDSKQLFAKGYKIQQNLRKQLPPAQAIIDNQAGLIKEKDEVHTFFTQLTAQEIAPKQHQQWIDSETFQSIIAQIEDVSKWTFFGLLVYSFAAGSVNTDFMWSYLGVLQLVTHLSAMRIKYPISATLAAKSLLSISVLDISKIQATLLNNTLFDVSKWASPLISITPVKNETHISGQSKLEREISTYQLYELGYVQGVDFYSNLRSTKVFVFTSGIFTVLTGVVWILTRANESVKTSWRTTAILRRIWTYMGPNAIFRIVLLQYILVIFAGWTTFQQQLVQILNGQIEGIQMTGQFLTFSFMTLTPLLILIPIPCLSKETLRTEYLIWNFGTAYWKSNLISKWSKSYPLLLLIQKLVISFIIIGIQTIIYQILAILGFTVAGSWFLLSVRSQYLDKDLKRFEIFNQAFLSFAGIFVVMFTNFMPSTQTQYDVGYIYTYILLIYHVICLIIITLYVVVEPITTWIRLRELRLHQIRLAQELRACLIREAKERKEVRKQKKLKAFNDFQIELGNDLPQEDINKTQDDEEDLTMIPGWIDAENMIPKHIKDFESSDSEVEIANNAQIGGRLSRAPFGKEDDLDGKNMQTINEEDFEGSLNGSLPGLDAIFDQNQIEETRLETDVDYGLHDFNEDDYQERLDKLSLMDRDRYLELLKLKHKYSNMKADLVRADQQDDSGDTNIAKGNAWGINVQYNSIVSVPVLNQERNRIQERREEGDPRNRTSTESLPPINQRNQHVAFKDEAENLEYAAMIAAIDAKLKEFNEELRKIEEDNGIFDQTRDTFHVPDEEERKYNILEVFQVEIEN